MSLIDKNVNSQWSKHFISLSKKNNTPMFLIVLIVASLLLVADFLFGDYPLLVTYIRIAVTLLGFISYLLYKRNIISSNLMVLIYVIPTSLTGCYMISIQTRTEGIIQATSLALVFGFVMIAMFTLSHKTWIIISAVVILPYLTVVIFLGHFPIKVYMANAGALLILCYAGLPYVAYLQYRLYKKNFLLQNKIEYYANNDILTGCFNRRGGLNILQQSLRMAERNKTPLSITFIDVDGLKAVNDQRGHSEGDKLLQATTVLIQEKIRKSDSLFRYGGDEFIIIFPGCKKEECSRIMTNIHEAALKNKESKLSFSYGIAEYSPVQSLEEFIGEADARMYENKNSRLRSNE